MSRGIINSINSKDKLYFLNGNNISKFPNFNNLKTNFNTYKTIIKRSTVEEKGYTIKMCFFSYYLRKT